MSEVPRPPESDGAAPGSELAASAAKAAGWLHRTGWRVARRIPGGDAAEREVRRLESTVLDEVRRALDEPAAPPGPGSTTYDESVPGRNGQGDGMLRKRMAGLLEQSVEVDRTTSERLLHEKLLAVLLPDEARILAALSDGSAYPVIDVTTKAKLGNGEPVLSNISTVGRAAGVVALDNVPGYLARLQALGLVELGPADPAHQVQYDILATNQEVAGAQDSVPRGTRLVRRTVRLTALGRRFWQACDPAGE